MKHAYKVTGMTCSSCAQKVKTELQKMSEIISADVNAITGIASIEMKKHLSTGELQKALDPLHKYTISEDSTDSGHVMHEENKTWVQTYKPLIVIFIYIAGVSALSVVGESNFTIHNFMNKFMAGFFLVFSFFKFLDLKGFAESYSTYDLLAKKVNSYGYVYPFIELALGVAYLINFNPYLTNLVTILVMGFSSIGVIQSVLDKRKIRCACLGSVFNLPMTTVTIIEDLLMVTMAVVMLMLYV